MEDAVAAEQRERARLSVGGVDRHVDEVLPEQQQRQLGPDAVGPVQPLVDEQRREEDLEQRPTRHHHRLPEEAEDEMARLVDDQVEGVDQHDERVRVVGVLAEREQRAQGQHRHPEEVRRDLVSLRKAQRRHAGGIGGSGPCSSARAPTPPARRYPAVCPTPPSSPPPSSHRSSRSSCARGRSSRASSRASTRAPSTASRSSSPSTAPTAPATSSGTSTGRCTGGATGWW